MPTTATTRIALAGAILRCAAAWILFPAILQGADAGSKFSTMVVPTIQYAYQDISGNTPSTYVPVTPVANKIVRQQTLRLVVVFLGETLDSSGRGEVGYDISIVQPDGRMVGMKNQVALHRRRINPQFVQSAENGIGFSAEDTDPLGAYKVHVVAYDRVGDRTAEADASFDVVAPEIRNDPPASFDFDSWMTGYYRNPDPGHALSALIAISRSPFGRRPEYRQAPFLGFFEQVLDNNPWLAQQFKQRLAATTDQNERQLLAQVLVYTYRNEFGYGQDLSGPARNAFAEVHRGWLPVPSTEPINPGQLDAYWGRFLASGRVQPIRDLVAVVRNYTPFEGKLAAYKRLAQRPKDVPLEVRKDLVLQAALWSLASNAKQHDLVRAYLAYMIDANDTSPAMKSILRAVIARKLKD